MVLLLLLFLESEYLDPDEKAFERLNNAPPRILASVPRSLQSAAHSAGYSVPELCKTVNINTSDYFRFLKLGGREKKN